MFASSFYPQRIICLTEETTETLYILGEQQRIVGISGFTVRPKQVRKEKPVVCTFIDAKIDKILELQPDLVIGFSDIQADIAKQLIAAGITVWVNNYRSVEGIYKMIFQLGTWVGKQAEAVQYIMENQQKMADFQQKLRAYPRKPKVYFEEWFEPIIVGSCWVSELIALAGGEDIFRQMSTSSLAKDRMIHDLDTVVALNPDIIIASWCGKKFKKQLLVARKNWQQIAAVKNDFIFEIKSAIILQPGPASITEGFEQIANIILTWHQQQNKS